MDLKFSVHVKILRPVAQVFKAVQSPGELSQYFATGGASAALTEGATVTWSFHDYPGAFPVKVTKVVPNQLIAFEWESNEGGYNTRTEIKFEPLGPKTTLVTISESGWKKTQKGLDSSYGNCHGWTQMSAALKVWLEHGIKLRQDYYNPPA